MDIYDQRGHSLRLEWGCGGARRATERGDAVVIVDTFRFGTAAITAVAHGCKVLPCKDKAEVLCAVESQGAVEVTKSGPGYSLSPDSLLSVHPGTLLAMPSPNGGACCQIAAESRCTVISTVANASATAGIVSKLLEDGSVSVIACGAHWDVPNADEQLRFTTEDFIGAGAILSHFESGLSPEAEICRYAFLGVRHALERVFLDCSSGRKLRSRGQERDAVYASMLDRHSVVPLLKNGILVGTTRA